MTVREFTERMWYGQQICIIKWKEFDKCDGDIDKIRTNSLMVGLNHHLRSDTYKDANNMMVNSYGVIDNTLIIEVH